VLQYGVHFTWDPAKAASNARKHGVTFEEAQSAFADPMGSVVDDFEHGEGRYVLIGVSASQRLLYVVHVETGQEVFRIVSARRATKNERRRYEEGD
jgi:uncharacterized DUF497 family protein